MEVIKRKPTVKAKYHIKDEVQAGEGRLVLELRDDNVIVIDHKMRIHLDSITNSGFNGGNRRVKLMFIGPKDINIKRIEDKNE